MVTAVCVSIFLLYHMMHTIYHLAESEKPSTLKTSVLTLKKKKIRVALQQVFILQREIRNYEGCKNPSNLRTRN